MFPAWRQPHLHARAQAQHAYMQLRGQLVAAARRTVCTAEQGDRLLAQVCADDPGVAAMPAIQALGVSYFAASVDAVDVNTRFAESLGLSYPILSDATKEVARAYGVLAPSGYASRWTFYIGADGRILDIDKKVSAASHGRDVVAKLTELRVRG